MNVLVVTGIFPPDIGGPATYVPLIAGGLVGAGHHTTVVTLADGPDHGDSGEPYGVIRIRRSPAWRRRLEVMRTLLREGRRAQVWLVAGLALEATLVNLVCRRPLALKVVGDQVWERATALGRTTAPPAAFRPAALGSWWRLMHAAQRWWCSRAHRVIVPSGSLAAMVQGWGVAPERVTVIPNAVDCGSIPRIPAPNGRRLRLVTVGRLLELKGIAGIVRAVAKVPEAELTVVGDGPEEGPLRVLAGRLGCEDRVVFTGRLGWRDTLARIASSQLLVLNSSHEGLPHVVIEAQALGVPVVATRVGGVGELVRHGETGLLVEPEDEGALERAIAGLAADPQRRLALAAAARREAGRFSLPLMVDRTVEVLADARDGRGGSG